MNAAEKFRKTIKLSQYIDQNLELLARVVEEATARGTVYVKLLSDLKELYPESDAEQLAQDLITERCRSAYLKLQAAKSVTNYMNDR